MDIDLDHLATPHTGAQRAVSVVLDGRLVVCGGRVSSGNIRNDCHFLNASTNAWEAFAAMPERRTDAASVMTPDGWWVLGMYRGRHGLVK